MSAHAAQQPHRPRSHSFTNAVNHGLLADGLPHHASTTATVAATATVCADPKLNEEFKVKTFGGAVVSVIAVVAICVLFVGELRLFLSVDTVDHLYVDVSRGEKLRINFDVTFPFIPCSLLSVDAMDVSGSHQLDVSAHIKKVPLGEDGSPVGEEELHSMEAAVQQQQQQQHDDGGQQQQQRARHAAGVTSNLSMADIQEPSYCGPCYGAESYSGQCCRTCDDVKEQYRVRGWAMPVLTTVEQCVASGQTVDPAVADLANHRGCRMYGYLEVNKGNTLTGLHAASTSDVSTLSQLTDTVTSTFSVCASPRLCCVVLCVCCVLVSSVVCRLSSVSCRQLPFRSWQVFPAPAHARARPRCLPIAAVQCVTPHRLAELR